MSEAGFYNSGPSGIPGRLLFEALGTFFLVLVGTKTVTDAVTAGAIAGAPTGSTGVALAFGGTLTVLVYALGPRTGCHINPAVTFAAIVSRSIRVSEGVLYMVAQIAGAIAASFTLKATLPSASVTKAKLGLNTVSSGYSLWDAFIYETLGTFLLVLVVLFAAVSSRVHQAASGIAVGGALFLAVLFAGSVTGGGINPARVLGPMFGIATFSNWWVYILAELTGATVAAILYISLGRVRASQT